MTTSVRPLLSETASKDQALSLSRMELSFVAYVVLLASLACAANTAIAFTANPVLVEQDGLFITVGSGGSIPAGLPASFSVHARSSVGRPKLSVKEPASLPESCAFTDRGDGTGSIRCSAPPPGQYPVVFRADAGGASLEMPFTVYVAEHGYPPENPGAMVNPIFPPPGNAIVIHVALSGLDGAAGTEDDPSSIQAAISRAASEITPNAPVYVLFKRGERWPAKQFVITQDLKGYNTAPIVFGAFGSGEPPRFESLFSQKNIEYLHFQDIAFDSVRINANRYHKLDSFYSGTSVPQLALDERLVVQRIRFWNCVFYNKGLRFFNAYQNRGVGSKVPAPNSWIGGGPLAGVVRDVEIAYSDFVHAGAPDAIQFNAPDRGVWIHHNTFLGSLEEHIDIAGGVGHIIEHNKGYGARGNGIKIHSQFSHVADCTIRNNTILYAGGWDLSPVGTRGNALVVENVSGCLVVGNNLISRWSAVYGDRDRGGTDDAYYQTFAGNTIRDNAHGGGVSMMGMAHHAASQIASRNTFEDNLYSPWHDSNVVIRVLSAEDVRVDTESFTDWVRASSVGESLMEFEDLFVDPFVPSDANARLDLDHPGDWRRRIPAPTNPRAKEAN